MYNTLLGVDVPVNLMARLDEMARAQEVTRSELVRGALAKFAGVELVPSEHRRANRDNKESTALAIIRAHPEKSLSQLLDLFRAAGIKRGHNWIAVKRREVFAV